MKPSSVKKIWKNKGSLESVFLQRAAWRTLPLEEIAVNQFAITNSVMQAIEFVPALL